MSVARRYTKIRILKGRDRQVVETTINLKKLKQRQKHPEITL